MKAYPAQNNEWLNIGGGQWQNIFDMGLVVHTNQTPSPVQLSQRPANKALQCTAETTDWERKKRTQTIKNTRSTYKE